MTENTKLKLAYGRRSYPDNVKAVWGARLIYPNDLLYDRQDLVAQDEQSKGELIAWLNGNPQGRGAINSMRIALTAPISFGITKANDIEAVIYEDDKGKIVGSAQSSHGYVYVCGWLKEHVA